MNYLPCVEICSGSASAPVGSVIWLHGLGADGHDFVPLVPELQLPAALNLRFIFPHAPARPVTVNGGYMMPAWYDILELTLDRRVDEKQLRESAQQVADLIEREVARGIPAERIVLAGFSQGGAVAYEAALSFAKPLAGLLAMSTYFATAATASLHSANKALPILIQHGLEDEVVDEHLGQRARDFLQAAGYKVDYQTYAMPHTLCAEQVVAISRWLQQRFAVY